ncbi:MAG: nitroreductase family protein [Prevotellaceae bacterium]|jgi:nitroreductase|nr:nitroreductase family protein [Prevotellaceae bacterium]
MKKFNVYQITSLILIIVVLVLIFKDDKNMCNPKDTTLEVIHNRKSVRKYIDRPVSKEDLTTLVKAGMAAPSAKNVQPWAFVIVTERESLDGLAEKLPFAKMLKNAPAAIAVCGDLTKSKEPQASLWYLDCSAATQNILLAAESMGLGAVWTAAYPYKERVQPIQEILGMPETTIPLCVIPIGYSDGTEQAKNKWKEENVKWEKW